MNKILPILIFTLLVSSCKKDDFVPVKVSYFVTITDSNTVSILYNSDYFFDSQIRKPITFTSEGLSWNAQHIADSEEPYFIRVEYLQELKTETHFSVKVVFNDTLAVDSAVYTHSVPVIELQGTVRL